MTQPIPVAAYCRVSTDKEDQANSFLSQQQYFRDYITRNDSWELYEIYADEGISGTGTKKRSGFNRMIRDAMAGKFRLLLTKEVSRFSRNILDTIAYTRQLKSAGIGILFLTDGINTLDPDAELRLSIMASLAQEESRRTSSRVVWGQTRQMEKGVVFGQSLLGYDVKNGKITVNPEGAAIVRLIFHKYTADQASASAIARQLTRDGVPAYRGGNKWNPNTILKILKNEKYIGDLVQKKTYTPDYLTHEKRKNTGQVPLIRIENHHEPIISRETWDQAQQRLRQNNKHIAAPTTGHSSYYPFSGKIICGQCGSCFVSRIRSQKNGGQIRRWRCATAVRCGTAACDVGLVLREDDVMGMLKTAVRSLPMDQDAVIGAVTSLIRTGESSTDRLRRDIQIIQKKKEAMLDAFLSGDLAKSEMHAMKQRYDSQLQPLQEKLTAEESRKEADAPIIQREIAAILNGETENDLFGKTILQSLTVFKDRHLELRLHYFPSAFHFTE